MHSRKFHRTIKKILANIYHPIIAILVYFLFNIIGFFSLSFLRKTAYKFGNLFYFLFPKYRILAKQNLRIAFPNITDKEIKYLIPQIFTSSFLLLLEVAWAAYNPQKMKKLIEIPNDIKELLENGGCFAITPHLGNWELLAQAAVLNNIQAAAVAKQLSNPYLYKLILSIRTRNGLEIIDSRGAIRHFIKVIREGKPVGLLIDQALSPRKGGVFIEFFNMPATCSRSVASIALKLKVPIIICACVRTKKGFKIIKEELKRPLSSFQNDIDLTQEIIHCNENMIKAYPEEYAWFYPRWRYIPEECPENLRCKFPSYALKNQKKE